MCLIYMISHLDTNVQLIKKYYTRITITMISGFLLFFCSILDYPFQWLVSVYSLRYVRHASLRVR